MDKKTEHYKIKYLDGPRLKRALIAGCHAIVNNQNYLNAINVFPVPDGDTGTNMATTVRQVMADLTEKSDGEIHKISREVADSALMGAQGNSGVILAQYFFGLAEEMTKYDRVTTKDFGVAVQKAVQYAYDALAFPREGTIITVIRDWAEKVNELAEEMDDFVEMLELALEHAKESLANTPKLLKVLADAGVVDAGAQGFINLLEGVGEFIESGEIRGLKNKALETIQATSAASSTVFAEPGKYRYCTECFVEGENIPRKEAEAKLREFGDSLILAGSNEKIKIHIHTDEPRKVFEFLSKYGKVSREKADDMKAQQKASHVDKNTIALVTDSTCGLPQDELEKYNVNIVPVRMSFGGEHFIDGVTITAEEFYKKLETENEHPTTSQPAPGDFKRMFEFLASHYKTILSVHLAGSLSGTLQSAVSMKRHFPDQDLRFVDSNNLSIGLGLIIREVAKKIQSGETIEKIIDFAESVKLRVKLFAAVDTVEYLVKGGRVSKLKGGLANLLKKVPVLTVTDEGKVEKLGTAGKGKQFDKLYEIFKKSAIEKSGYRFAVAHSEALELAEKYAEKIKKDFSTEDVYVIEISPVLGVHFGPGALAITFLGK